MDSYSYKSWVELLPVLPVIVYFNRKEMIFRLLQIYWVSCIYPFLKEVYQ